MNKQLNNLLKIQSVSKIIELNVGRLGEKLNRLYRFSDLEDLDETTSVQVIKAEKSSDDIYQETVNSIAEVLGLNIEVYAVVAELYDHPTIVPGSIIINNIPYVMINDMYVSFDAVDLESIKQSLQKII